MEKSTKKEKLTPMERQYGELKAQHTDKILFFRLGDFYEMFGEDAEIASGILNIALTKRHDTPMCGFPHHAAKNYIQKLISAGRKIAVCEQLEDPGASKGIVKRGVTQIITPGTILEDDFISQNENNFLLCLYGLPKKSFGLSIADISTGEFFVNSSGKEGKYRFLQDEIARFSPSEILFNERLADDPSVVYILEQSGALFQSYPEWFFEENQTDDGMLSKIEIPDLSENPELSRSLNGCFNYLLETQNESTKSIRRVVRLEKNKVVELDDFTLRNLELVKNMQDGSKRFTLLETIDQSLTPMAGRLLKRWITLPLQDLTEIYRRQNFVQSLLDENLLRERIREILREISDIERLTTRVVLSKAIPRDLCFLADSIESAEKLKIELSANDFLKKSADQIPDLADLVQIIRGAVNENPPSTFGGKIIRRGFSEELDELIELMSEGKNWITRLQNRERQRTGISSLKVKFNKAFGYFIEVSKTNADKVPNDYLRKQSLVNAERFTLPELSEYEQKITTAEDKAVHLEEKLFLEIVARTAEFAPDLQKLSETIAELDVFSSFAQTAEENHYVKPQISKNSEFHIQDGRHPVVEKHLGFNLFVSNDCKMDHDENRILILTGPNMAGKSTYLRQNALIAVMAQIGSFVPAKSASLPVIDKIFTRIGASDELSAGRSTFLVEMEEAANILNNATKNSLIIMDELGRGTATYDGLAIAWAVIEFLHENPRSGGMTLFATHYHELTRMSSKRGIKNYSIAVSEYNDELIFLRRVLEGPADRSYGIHVAKMAGIPDEAVRRARVILENLEKYGQSVQNEIEAALDKEIGRQPTPKELELFPSDEFANIREKIKNLDLNRMTPLEAITFLSEIQREISEKED